MYLGALKILLPIFLQMLAGRTAFAEIYSGSYIFISAKSTATKPNGKSAGMLGTDIARQALNPPKKDL
ncbi:MAG: hypothetical protein FIA99_00655 [Ruminiclostridium sp.]|nr:hypothetical protein [Ruminiclostridium sp.]